MGSLINPLEKIAITRGMAQSYEVDAYRLEIQANAYTASGDDEQAGTMLEEVAKLRLRQESAYGAYEGALKEADAAGWEPVYGVDGSIQRLKRKGEDD